METLPQETAHDLKTEVKKCQMKANPPQAQPKQQVDPTYKMLKKVNNELKKLFESGEINKTMYDKMRTTFSNAPQLYELPKIHKPDVPLRPIVSTIGSATYYLAKELTKTISPLAGKSFSFVQDSSDFVQKIKNIRLEEDTVLVSFDVVQLFTKVPIEESLEVTIMLENNYKGLNTTLSVESI